MCKSKIHRAKVTEADLNYMGSITIDKTVLKAVNMIEYEQVHVLNITNGNRFITYTIEGEADSGIVCLNGAAARLVSKEDRVIIISYAEYSEKELGAFRPAIAIMSDENKIIEMIS
jgi:aspartate 1-decarboxylase